MLIVSFSKAIRLIYENLNNNYNYVLELNKYLQNKLSNINNVAINSNKYCLPYILNISVSNIKSETLMHALAEYDIYVSTKTACNTDDYSISVYELTKDMNKAKSSLRISLSHLTTKEELDIFIDKLQVCIEKLR